MLNELSVFKRRGILTVYYVLGCYLKPWWLMIQFVTNPTELDVIQLMQLPVSFICYKLSSFIVCTWYAYCMSGLCMSSSFITPRVVDWIPCQTLLRNNLGQVVHTLLPRDVESLFFCGTPTLTPVLKTWALTPGPKSDSDSRTYCAM